MSDGTADSGTTSDTQTTGTTGSSTTAASSTPTSDTTQTSTNGTSTTSDESSTGESTISSFLSDLDGGGKSIECSFWEEDCPRGEKCMPWANDGGNAWNALRCSPIAPNPDQADEPCTVEGSGVSGVDSCDIHSMCLNVDAQTDIGTCVPMCVGSKQAPTCEDPYRSCSISGSGILALCRPPCDPIGQDCVSGQGCYLLDETTSCAPDASGELGTYGDPCEFINACDPGLSCEDAAATPGCTAEDCCTPFCDLTAPNECPGIGQECVPVIDPADAPPVLENVGLCRVP